MGDVPLIDADTFLQCGCPANIPEAALRERLLLADQRPTTKRLEPGSCTSMYPYVALRGPTYREISHANHTWHQQSHQTACFNGSEAPSVWVRFPPPAPNPEARGTLDRPQLLGHQRILSA
jgi:hypothetical protein